MQKKAYIVHDGFTGDMTCLLWSVPNKHAPLHLGNMINSPEHHCWHRNASFRKQKQKSGN